jgi:hypothetical protein
MYAPCHLVTSEGQEVKDNALRPQGLMTESGQSRCWAYLHTELQSAGDLQQPADLTPQVVAYSLQ